MISESQLVTQVWDCVVSTLEVEPNIWETKIYTQTSWDSELPVNEYIFRFRYPVLDRWEAGRKHQQVVDLLWEPKPLEVE